MSGRRRSSASCPGSGTCASSWAGGGWTGAKQAGLFDTLKYWDGRFDQIKLEGLKFSVALPRRLAEATLSARLADLTGARIALDERHRFQSSL